MIIIYTQDKTIIHKNADCAKRDILDLYGEKLGQEAYCVVRGGLIGASYRKYGGPLVVVVSKEKAERIQAKELSIGIKNSNY